MRSVSLDAEHVRLNYSVSVFVFNDFGVSLDLCPLLQVFLLYEFSRTAIYVDAFQHSVPGPVLVIWVFLYNLPFSEACQLRH